MGQLLRGFTHGNAGLLERIEVVGTGGDEQLQALLAGLCMRANCLCRFDTFSRKCGQLIKPLLQMSRLRAVCVELRAMLLSQGRQQGLALALTFISRVLPLQGSGLL